MSKPTGGPAFPTHGSMGEVVHEGMTLRDYFAAKAMYGQIDHETTEEEATLARRAYALADAMIAEREKSSATEPGAPGTLATEAGFPLQEPEK